jgi:hypothetical protein
MSWPCRLYSRTVLGFWWKKRRMIGESGVKWGASGGFGWWERGGGGLRAGRVSCGRLIRDL